MEFLKLVSIENMKLWKRLSTKIMLLIILLLVIAVPCGIKVYQNSTTKNDTKATVDKDWKEKTKLQLAQNEKQLAAVKKSSSKPMKMTQGSMEKTVAEEKYSIEHNIAPSTETSIWKRVIDIDTTAGYGSFIGLMLIIACTAQIAGEFSEGTMKMMISRPYSRSQILSAKLISSILYGLTLLVATFIINFVLTGALFSFTGMSTKAMLWNGTKLLYIPGFLKALAIFGLDFLTVLFYTIFAFMLSTITRSRSLATGFALFMVLFGGGLVQLAAIFFDWAKYLPFAATGFTSIVISGAAIPGVTLNFAIISSLIYIAVMLFAGYFTFQKRDI